MQSIYHRAQLNIGGNSEIYLVKHANLLAVPGVVDGTISGDITMLAGWTLIDTTAYSIAISEKEIETAAGVLLEITVSFRISRQAESYATAIKALHKERLAVLVKNHNGQYVLIGNAREYLKHKRTMATGAASGTLHQATINLTGKLTTYPAYYSGSVDIAATIAGLPVFNLAGNLELYLIRHTAVAFVPDSDSTGEVPEDSLQLAELWSDIQCLPYSIDYEEAEQDNTAGTAIEVKISFVLAQDQPNLRAKLALLRSERLAALVGSANGYFRLVGNAREYLKYSREYSSGALPVELNAHRITLAGRLLSIPVFYKSSKPTQISPTNEFDPTDFDEIEFN